MVSPSRRANRPGIDKAESKNTRGGGRHSLSPPFPGRFLPSESASRGLLSRPALATWGIALSTCLTSTDTVCSSRRAAYPLATKWRCDERPVRHPARVDGLRRRDRRRRSGRACRPRSGSSRLTPDLSVVVLEKGSEVGAHILSGAVIDPIGLDRLLPDWRSEETPARDAGDRRPFLLARAGRRDPLAEHPDAAADAQSRHLHRVAGRCLPLAGRQGRGAGRRDLPRLRRGRDVARRCRRGRRRRHRRHGRRPRRQAQARLPARHGAARQIHADRRGRARLARQAAHRPLRARRTASEPQKFGIGLKELWQVAPEKHRPGLVQHTFGWPLDNRTGGGSFLYHFGENLVSIGFVVHLNYANPYLSPFEEFQRFKTHPLIASAARGRQGVCPTARAPSPKAAGSRCRSLSSRAAR